MHLGRVLAFRGKQDDPTLSVGRVGGVLRIKVAMGNIATSGVEEHIPWKPPREGPGTVQSRSLGNVYQATNLYLPRGNVSRAKFLKPDVCYEPGAQG